MTKLDFSSDLFVPSPEVLPSVVSAPDKVFCSHVCKMLAEDLGAEVPEGSEEVPTVARAVRKHFTHNSSSCPKGVELAQAEERLPHRAGGDRAT